MEISENIRKTHGRDKPSIRELSRRLRVHRRYVGRVRARKVAHEGWAGQGGDGRPRSAETEAPEVASRGLTAACGGLIGPARRLNQAITAGHRSGR